MRKAMIVRAPQGTTLSMIKIWNRQSHCSHLHDTLKGFYSLWTLASLLATE